MPGNGTDPAPKGGLFALAAFLIWGAFPLFFKLLSPIPAWEVLAHRSLWTFVFCTFLLSIMSRWHHAVALMLDKGVLLGLVFSSVLISANWLVFIWAIANGYVLQSSLGYFITVYGSGSQSPWRGPES